MVAPDKQYTTPEYSPPEGALEAYIRNARRDPLALKDILRQLSIENASSSSSSTSTSTTSTPWSSPLLYSASLSSPIRSRTSSNAYRDGGTTITGAGGKDKDGEDGSHTYAPGLFAINTVSGRGCVPVHPPLTASAPPTDNTHAPTTSPSKTQSEIDDSLLSLVQSLAMFPLYSVRYGFMNSVLTVYLQYCAIVAQYHPALPSTSSFTNPTGR